MIKEIEFASFCLRQSSDSDCRCSTYKERQIGMFNTPQNSGRDKQLFKPEEKQNKKDELQREDNFISQQ